MQKWQRNYYAKLVRGKREGYTYIPEEEITIQYPYTCNFDINMGIYDSSMQAIFEFINLPRDLHAKLWKDRGDERRYITIEFYAGYQDNMPLLFRGNFIFCNTEKSSGSTEFITTAQAALDVDIWKNLYANYTFFKGTELQNIVETLLADSPEVFTGYITPKIEALLHNRTYIGQPLDLLEREFAGYNVFISPDGLNILKENEVIPGDIQVITAASGLLGSPRRSDSLVEVAVIFEPGIKAGQAIQVLSDSIPFLNQFYRVLSVKHSGTISGAVCGNATTFLTLQMLGENFEVLKGNKYIGYQGQQTSGKWLKPVQGQVSSAFGARSQPTAGASTNHEGIDIACVNNSDVIAPANGVVQFAGSRGGYGYLLILDHGTDDKGQRITSRYGHLSKWLVNQQQTVSAGQLIAKSGGVPGQPGAGTSTGAHLHFEIRQGSIPVNPTLYIGNY